MSRLLKLREITEEKDALLAFGRFSSCTELPPFLFHEPRYRGVVLSLMDGGKQAGLCFGVVTPEERCFYLHHISTDKVHGEEETVLCFFNMVFVWLKERYSAVKVVISLEQEHDAEPPQIGLLKKLSVASIEEVRYIRQMGIKTSSFDQLRKFRWYRPQLLEQKGYEAIPWEECGREEVERLRKAEERQETAEDYLSPGLWEEEWEYDPKTSFALVKKGGKKPLGWMVTEPRKEGAAVKIRRFYIGKEERQRLAGHAFGSWMLDKIAEHYEELQYEVVRGNRQMEMFTDNFCKPHLIFHYYKCNIFINLTEED